MVSVIKSMLEEEVDIVSALADQFGFPAITKDCLTLVAQEGYTGDTMHGITNDWTLNNKTLAIHNLKDIQQKIWMFSYKMFVNITK